MCPFYVPKCCSTPFEAIALQIKPVVKVSIISRFERKTFPAKENFRKLNSNLQYSLHVYNTCLTFRSVLQAYPFQLTVKHNLTNSSCQTSHNTDYIRAIWSHSFKALSFTLQLNTFLSRTVKNKVRSSVKRKYKQNIDLYSAGYEGDYRWVAIVFCPQNTFGFAQSQTELQTLNLIHVFGNPEPLGSLW